MRPAHQEGTDDSTGGTELAQIYHVILAGDLREVCAESDGPRAWKRFLHKVLLICQGRPCSEFPSFKDLWLQSTVLYYLLDCCLYNTTYCRLESAIYFNIGLPAFIQPGLCVMLYCIVLCCLPLPLLLPVVLCSCCCDRSWPQGISSAHVAAKAIITPGIKSLFPGGGGEMSSDLYANTTGLTARLPPPRPATSAEATTAQI